MRSSGPRSTVAARVRGGRDVDRARVRFARIMERGRALSVSQTSNWVTLPGPVRLSLTQAATSPRLSPRGGEASISATFVASRAALRRRRVVASDSSSRCGGRRSANPRGGFGGRQMSKRASLGGLADAVTHAAPVPWQTAVERVLHRRPTRCGRARRRVARRGADSTAFRTSRPGSVDDLAGGRARGSSGRSALTVTR